MNNALFHHENININKMDENSILSLFKTKNIFEIIHLIPEIDLNIKKQILDYTHSYFSEYIMDTLIRRMF